MTYRQLQAALKELRNQGKTTIKLNQKKEILQAEYDRLMRETKVQEELFIPSGDWKLGDYCHLYGSAQYELLQQMALERANEQIGLYRNFYARSIELGLSDRDPGFDGGTVTA